MEDTYHEVNISNMPDYDVFSLLEFHKRTARSQEIKKNGNCKRKNRIQKLANCTLRDLAGILDVHGRRSMVSYLSSLPFKFYVVWILRLTNFARYLIDYMMMLYLLGVILSMLFAQTSIPKLIT